MLDLGSVLANRGWLKRTSPFPHIVACDVFTLAYYDALAEQVREILDRGLSEHPAPGRFSRNIRGYDAYGLGLDHSFPDPLALFLSAAWRDMLSRLFDVGRTPYVFAGAHHHAVGGKNGFIHNDFNPVWFPRARDGEIRIPDQEVCAYKTGEGTLAAHQKTEVLRGAAMIFFLLNDGWRPGDGGETALYASAADAVSKPIMRCPPQNNRLLAFECTPGSFHSYLANWRLPRTSIIMWVHRTMAEGTARYGEDRLERWKH